MLFDEKLSKEDIKKIKKVAVDLLDSKIWQISAFLGIGEIVKLLGVIVKMLWYIVKLLWQSLKDWSNR